MSSATADGLLADARARGLSALSEIDSKRIIGALGIATAEARAAASADDAARIASGLGFPVALKVLSPDVTHKSDVGGVALNLATDRDVRAAFENIRAAVAANSPGARFDGVAVQPMAPPGVEVLVGVTRDDRFGPITMVGIGGVLVEVLKDTALRLAPIGKLEARAMLAELRAGALLRGARGREPADLEALANLIASVSEFAAAHPEIREMDLNPVAVYPRGLRVLDARILLGEPPQSAGADPHHRERVANLRRAFDAKRVAVIGDKKMGGYLWLRSLARFTGELYSVQIDPNEIPGIEAMGVSNYRTLADIGAPIDYAVSAVPRQVAPRILRDCIENRVGSIGFFTSGFSETGEEIGRKLEEELRRLALESEIALVGPNCMGLYNPANGLCNFPELRVGEAGDVCFISQSGTHTINFSLQAAARCININKAASIGNVLVLEAADYLEAFADDPRARVIGMYIEGVRDGRRFFDALSRAAARMPALVWKGGMTEAGARATFSHTGSLATAAAVWSAMVRQAGAVEVAGLDAMLDAVELFARGKPVRGRAMGLVAMTGGQSVVVTDTFAAQGLDVPALSPASYEELKSFFNVIGGSYRNPLDAGGTLGGGVHHGNLDRILSILDRDPVIDAIVLEIGTGLRAARWARHEEEIVGLLDKVAGFSRATAKPFAIILHPAHVEAIVARAHMLARERGLVVFDSFERAAAAFRTAAEYCERAGRRPSAAAPQS